MTVTDETQTKVTPRLKTRYRAEIAPALREQFSYAERHADPGRGPRSS
jgi:large subunit ribosomal protein L5